MSGALTDAGAVFRNATFDMSGFADPAAAFGKSILGKSLFTSVVAVFGNAILDLSAVVKEEVSSVANLGRLWGLWEAIWESRWVTLGCPWGAFG